MYIATRECNLSWIKKGNQKKHLKILSLKYFSVIILITQGDLSGNKTKKRFNISRSSANFSKPINRDTTIHSFDLRPRFPFYFGHNRKHFKPSFPVFPRHDNGLSRYSPQINCALIASARKRPDTESVFTTHCFSDGIDAFIDVAVITISE